MQLHNSMQSISRQCSRTLGFQGKSSITFSVAGGMNHAKISQLRVRVV